ncbi:MAG: class I mannose-6-phosphate isomerase [Clostridia bacterium]|nr:class I mannose-6-phosphate isomerase [Clostridia bacterium]
MRQPLLKTGETRVWRTYTGGAALDVFHGRPGENGSLPEDWAASTTRAFNPGREELVEGLSRVVSLPGEPYLADVIAEDPEGFFGKAHVGAFGPKAGFLVKLIDAAERLTIQVHPDRDYAKAVLGSDYGKTESWYILGGNGAAAEPCIYMGFKPGITRERWKSLFEAQDIAGMLACLHRIPVRAGECYFIAAGMPHAIGAGCFLAEIQEPTDYTMRTELVTPGGLRIDERQCHQGVGYERMLDCFHYCGESLEETLARYRSEPMRVLETAGGTVDSLIDRRQTDLFSMSRIRASGELTLPEESCMRIFIAVEGEGELRAGGCAMSVRRGETVVARADCPELTLHAPDGLTLLACRPPQGAQNP